MAHASARWSELSPLLDQALEQTLEERAAFVATVRTRDTALADELESWLADHQALQQTNFLEDQALASTTLRLLAGQRIGAYTLLEPIGHGGMSSVWLARRSDGRFEGRFAIKFLNIALVGRASAERFAREGNILAQLRHPHIAALADAGVADSGQPYLVLEYVPGQPIDAYCDAHELDIDARLRLFIDVLAAVEHAHRNLIVHRDLKAANVLVDADGQVKLLDFGIAKLLQDDAGLTQDAGNALTPNTAAPEQISGGAITTATDVYALGVLLYRLLTGAHPTTAVDGDALSWARAIVEQDAAAPSTVACTETDARQRRSTPAGLRARLRGDLDIIVLKSLKKAPEDRYASVAEFRQDLVRTLDNRPIAARKDSAGYRLRKFLRRNRVPVAATLALVLVAALMGAQTVRQRQDLRLAQTRAQSVDGLLQSILSGLSPETAERRLFSAQELLGRAQTYLEKDTAIDADARFDVTMRIATLYGELGYWDQAGKGFEEARKRAAQTQDKREELLALLKQTEYAVHAGKQDDYQALRATAVAQLDANVPASDELRVRLQLIEGMLAQQQNRFEPALAANEAAAATLAAIGRPDLSLIAWSEFGQGEALVGLGRLVDARTHLLRARQLYAQRGGDKSTGVQLTDLLLLRIATRLGEYEWALKELDRMVPALTERFGPEDTRAASALSSRVFAQIFTGRFDAARLTLSDLEQKSGKRQNFQAFIVFANALIAMYEGRYSEAEPVLANLPDRQPPGSLLAETHRRNYGELLLRMGRNDQALSVLMRTQAGMAALAQAPDPVDIAQVQMLLGVALARSARLDEAAVQIRAALDTFTRERGDHYPTTLFAAAYCHLLCTTAPASQRAEIAARLEREFSWQHSALTLAAWLRQPNSRSWADLPTVR